MEKKQKINSAKWIVIGIYTFIIIFASYKLWDVYSKKSDLDAEYSVLKSEYKSLQDSVNYIEVIRQKERDSLNNEIALREKYNQELENRSVNLEVKIDKIKNKKVEIPNSLIDMTKYFNDRYNTESTKVVENKVGLELNTSFRTVYELEEKDKLSLIVPLKDSIILNKNSVINNLKSSQSNLQTMLSTADLEIQKRKKLQESADKNIGNLESQVKTLNKKAKWTRFLIPVSVVAGGIIGYSIAK